MSAIFCLGVGIFKMLPPKTAGTVEVPPSNKSSLMLALKAQRKSCSWTSKKKLNIKMLISISQFIYWNRKQQLIYQAGNNPQNSLARETVWVSGCWCVVWVRPSLKSNAERWGINWRGSTSSWIDLKQANKKKRTRPLFRNRTPHFVYDWRGCLERSGQGLSILSAQFPQSTHVLPHIYTSININFQFNARVHPFRLIKYGSVTFWTHQHPTHWHDLALHKSHYVSWVWLLEGA